MIDPATLAPTLHQSVLKKEVLTYLAPHGPGYYLDGTLGLGGHGQSVLEADPCLELIGLDRDSHALSYATPRLKPFGSRVHIVQANYADFSKVLTELGVGELQGALLDLGVSSLQLDDAARGFSFLSTAQLDMRMDQSTTKETAYDLVNGASEAQLRDILQRFGEEPKAASIAKAIILARQKHPICTTSELAQLVIQAYPKAWLKKSRHHPATRTFQALRMVVNDELGALKRFLEQILSWLVVGGRLVILSFHSLEDRLVKQFMQQKAKGCVCPPYVLECKCGHKSEVRILTKKPVQASAAELAVNSRASSAKLRCCEKL